MTERLVLRQLKLGDAPELFAYFAKDEVTEYYDLDSFTEQQQAASLIQRWNERFDRQDGIRWGIALKSEDRIIGTCGFHSWTKEHAKAEIGYELSPAYWQQGIMSEALGSVIPYGFESMGLNRIEAFIDPDNISSRKLLEKAGLREEGLLRDYFYEKGRFVDAVLFARLKRDC
ncbi:GNAT family N-acetyltransferase [Paenibacillus rhizovicinus]|uniref:GNAT family N-acetyltransferase n=1 Tax=Paenibacillus rhizovicinus TaxID=2704463 RepID=A0A6C0P8T1_9BACL|nr:GNAT family N-acetyltransferase [Paenibacillus rhizovicinus]